MSISEVLLNLSYAHLVMYYLHLLLTIEEPGQRLWPTKRENISSNEPYRKSWLDPCCKVSAKTQSASLHVHGSFPLLEFQFGFHFLHDLIKHFNDCIVLSYQQFYVYCFVFFLLLFVNVIFEDSGTILCLATQH